MRHIVKSVITGCVLIACGIEAACGILQMTGVMRSLHPDYLATGHFYNPGPYACFLAMLLPVAIRVYITAGSRWLRHLDTGIIVLTVAAISVSVSRTAWIACGIGTIIAMADYLRPKLRNLPVSGLIMILIAAVALAACGYYMKRASADGRLLMWKVAASAIGDMPATGVGWDNVAGVYGESQERYFASGAGSPAEMLVADAPEYVFNEYLQVAIAFGVISAVGMTLLLGGALAAAISARAYGYAGATAAVAVVMMASYPLQFPLSVIAIGLILTGAYLSARRAAVRWSGAIAVAGGCVLFLTHDDRTDISTQFAIGHSLHRMEEYRESNATLLSLLPHSSDPMILNIIAKNYRSLGMADSAAHYLNRSVNRCPNRLYPHYLLMQLYADSASLDRSRMLKEAGILMTMTEKINSPAVDEMRDKAREILNTSSK